MAKSIKKNTIYSIIKTCSSIVFPLITFPYISRVLLAENVGKIHFGMSIVSYFSLIASLGITTYAIRECSAVREDKKALSDVASQIFSINVLTTILSYILLATTLLFFNKLEGYRTLIIIQSLSIAFTTIGTDWLNSAMEDFKFITLRTVIFQILAIILMLVFVRIPDDYLKYAVISLVSTSGASIVNVFYRKRYCHIRFTLNIDIKKHIGPILFLFVMILAQDIYNNVDSTMLGLMHGDRAVGIYGAAHKMAKMINQLVAAILWVIMPRMSFYFAQNDYSQINKLLKKILGFNLLLGLPCAVGTTMLSKEIITIIAGKDFLEAAFVLQVLMIGFIFSLIGGNFLGNAILLPSKQEKYYMFVCCITAVLNIITNYIFIPLYGAVAAAGTTALCSFVMFIMLILKKDKKIHLSRIQDVIISPVIGSLAICIICFLLRTISSLWLRTILSVAISVAIYGVIQILAKNQLVYELINPMFKRLKKK